MQQSNTTQFTTTELLGALENEETGIFLNSNAHTDPYGKYDWLVAGGCIQRCSSNLTDLRKLRKRAKWLFGGLSYDLKNQLEKLTSNHPDQIDLPPLLFFEPAWVVYQKGSKQEIWKHPLGHSPKVKQLTTKKQVVTFQPTLSKAAYLQRVASIKRHIQLGDVYELTYCQSFRAKTTDFDAMAAYRAINEKTQAPFSGYLKWENRHLMCGSPERYLAKRGRMLVSQPIKGTAPRHEDAHRDKQNKDALLESVKERSENVMIVDLVRNDLSRIAASGSVEVPELFGIYSFETVHQMISTVTATLDDRFDETAAIAATFPMGSMTGAPKIRAMELIEQYESTRRGLFSGAIGYMDPDGDFDFNVIIRSLLYNQNAGHLSLQVGGAITILSDPEAEYEECLLKAKAIVNSLSKEA